jgi:hypothetical protein
MSKGASAVSSRSDPRHSTLDPLSHLRGGLISITGEKLGRLNHLKIEVVPSKSLEIHSPIPTRVMIK